MRYLDGITNLMDMSFNKLWKMMKDREAWMLRSWGHKDSDMTGQLNNNSNALNVDKDQIYMFLLVNHNITYIKGLYLTLCQALF